MTLTEAIEHRRSRRKYIPVPLEPAAADKLRGLIAEYSQKGNVRMELVLNDGGAFGGLTKSYGMFSGVRHYIGLIADKNDATSAERLGYYGELLALHAEAMGLGSCWVGGSFDRKSCPIALSENEKLACVITVGAVEERYGVMERLIRGITQRKSKSAEEMFTVSGGIPAVPAWFISGMEAVRKAPSAVNRQPVMFEYKDGRVSALVSKPEETSMALDFGIAKAHFELGAGGGQWQWGNGGEFALRT